MNDDTDTAIARAASSDEVILDDFKESPLEYLTTDERDAAYMALERISQMRRDAEVQSQNLRVG